MSIEESAHLLVKLALGAAFLDGGSPDVLLIDAVDNHSVALAAEASYNFV